MIGLTDDEAVRTRGIVIEEPHRSPQQSRDHPVVSLFTAIQANLEEQKVSRYEEKYRSHDQYCVDVDKIISIRIALPWFAPVVRPIQFRIFVTIILYSI